MAQLLMGILLHAIGASCASLCYLPQKKATNWSWQTYWLAQAVVCWLLLPFIGAWLTIPHLGTVLSEAPKSAMINAFLLGLAYGVGGTAFGMAIRYVGYSLTYAIAVGISCVLGTLLPPIVSGKLMDILHSNGSGLIITGITAGAIGIALCGVAGRYKEIDLEKKALNKQTFQFTKGLLLCLLAGFLSALYGFSIAQGEPIAEVAGKYGAGDLKGNVIYIFSNTGAFVTTLIYCIYLHVKYKTFGEYKNARGGNLNVYYLMAIITGVLWYSQFFFYGLGHVRLGEKYDFTSWAIHMIMLVLFSTLTGLLLREWAACNRKTIRILGLALTVLVAAVIVLTYGNYIGGLN